MVCNWPAATYLSSFNRTFYSESKPQLPLLNGLEASRGRSRRGVDCTWKGFYATHNYTEENVHFFHGKYKSKKYTATFSVPRVGMSLFLLKKKVFFSSEPLNPCWGRTINQSLSINLDFVRTCRRAACSFLAPSKNSHIWWFIGVIYIIFLRTYIQYSASWGSHPSS